ncbi:hypothetical protein [Streptomyces sp. NPDC046942]|uniref:hypothetical protein n=1 Tax=Streptomyces sp. NPDC046942 TaxID=3155137 RepID=UPI0033D6DD15
MRPPRLDGYDDLLRPLLERCLAADPDQRIDTEELAALCEETAGRRLNDFTGRRCPDPLAADLVAPEQAVLSLPPEPTVVDADPLGQHARHGGRRQAHGAARPRPLQRVFARRA